MKRTRTHTLNSMFPPSKPCSCDICRSFCMHPGWWTVAEASSAMLADYGNRMMLEIAPEMTFGVLAPAFYGCEGGVELQEYAKNGCNFLKDSLCELHGTGHQPLECRFCHHERMGQGKKCHEMLERDWNSLAGRALVAAWINKIISEKAPLFGCRL